MFVYLIKRTGAEPKIKIGIAVDPERRCSALATACPDELYVLKSIQVGRLARHIESAFKALMRSCVVRGEWYECDDTLAILALRAAERGDMLAASIVKTILEWKAGVDVGLSAEQMVYIDRFIPEWSRRPKLPPIRVSIYPDDWNNARLAKRRARMKQPPRS